jgi:uncharacterized protein YndB with AHSA1/START domain
MSTLSVTRTTFVAAPPERVWRAVTEPAQLERWYAPGGPWEIPALQAGAQVRFFNTPEDVQVATIAALDPGREISFRWQADPAQPGAEIVTAFRLEPVTGGTRVTLYESGYDTLPGDMGPALAAQAAEGYTASLEALKAHLEGVPA